MALAWLIVVSGWVFVNRMPDVYTVTARLYLDTESVLRPLMRGLALESNISQRLSLLTKTLLSRPNMEKLARLADLDVTATTTQKMDKLLTDLSDNIRLRTDRRDPNLYDISYSHNNPEIAKKVVQGLLTIIVESTLGESRENSSTAQQFLDKQIKEYETRLTETEEKLKQFKTKNTAMMPTLRTGYFQSLQTTQIELERAELELKEASNRRSELIRQMKGEEPVFGIVESSQKQQINSPLDSKIKDLKDQKNDLLLKYTDLHPQIVSIDEKIKLLEAQKRGEVSEKETGVASEPELDKNPVYQQIKLSLAQTEAQIATLQVRVKEYRERIDKLQNMIDTIPQIETELGKLNRDYTLNKKNYDALVARLETAKMSQDVEQTGDGVKIRVIDPPILPRTPSGPKRGILNAGVFVVAVALALVVSFFLSQLRPVFHDQRTLRLSTGIPVLGSVSRIWTPDLQKKKKIEYGGFIAAISILFISFGLVLRL